MYFLAYLRYCARMKSTMEITAPARFWAKVNKTETCWLWTAAIDGNGGYGVFHPTKKLSTRAHRWSWAETNGPIPEGLFVCHKCDVPTCVRPDHLFLGTKAENNADMIAKGRHAVGEQRGSKFTSKQVLRMRDMYNSGKTIAQISRAFSHNHSNISQIVQGVTWKHLLRPIDLDRGRKTSMGPPKSL